MPRGDGTPRRGSGQAGPAGAGPGTGSAGSRQAGRGMGMGKGPAASFASRRAGPGRGRMGGFGLGAGGNCVCPNCGKQFAHQRGMPYGRSDGMRLWPAQERVVQVSRQAQSNGTGRNAERKGRHLLRRAEEGEAPCQRMSTNVPTADMRSSSSSRCRIPRWTTAPSVAGPCTG